VEAALLGRHWHRGSLARAAKQQLGPVAAEERGPLLEGLVLTMLRTHNADSELFEEVSYWAPAQARQTEVDSLLRRGREFLAIEVKAQPRFSTPQLAGLRAIGELPRVVRRILVYLGERHLKTEDGIDVWPIDRFTSAAADGSL
jgi:predicted AAA+ superfamily ATPase